MEGKWPGKARKSVVVLTLMAHSAPETTDRSADLAKVVDTHGDMSWLEDMCRVS